MRNERNAGRKAICSKEKMLEYYQRNKDGESLSKLSREAGVSRQTMYNYFAAIEEQDQVAPIDETNSERYVCRDINYWTKLNVDFKDVKVGEYDLRLEYMSDDICMTSILIKPEEREFLIHNETSDVLHRAFGVNISPGWNELMGFLKHRCFPEKRDGLDIVLSDLELDDYDPFEIVGKTQGRMAEDHSWIKIYYYDREAQ